MEKGKGQRRCFRSVAEEGGGEGDGHCWANSTRLPRVTTLEPGVAASPRATHLSCAPMRNGHPEGGNEGSCPGSLENQGWSWGPIHV